MSRNYKFYNIRGWLKGINEVSNIGNDLFAFGIGYNQGTNPLYNGNISQTQWKTANTDSSLKTYDYTYDALNRITGATGANANYNLSSVSYDKNGNIKDLLREGHTNEAATTFGSMDNLSYYYNGNQLHSVTDSSVSTGFKDGNSSDSDYATTADNDFVYDVNGNMISDANKGITGITYNHLNLPTQVTFANGNIQYLYDAAGIKLQKTVIESGKSDVVTKYAGNYIYEQDVLQFLNHAEGYVEPVIASGSTAISPPLARAKKIKISASARLKARTVQE